MSKLGIVIIGLVAALWFFYPGFQEDVEDTADSLCNLTDYAIEEGYEFMDTEFGYKDWFEVQED